MNYYSQGSSPGWSWGVRSPIVQSLRRKRWVMTQPASSSASTVRITPAANSYRTISQGPNNRNLPPNANDIDSYNQRINQLNNNNNNQADVVNNQINAANNNQGGRINIDSLMGMPTPSMRTTNHNPSHDDSGANYDYDRADYQQAMANSGVYSTLSNDPITSQPQGPLTPASMLRSGGAAGTMFGNFMNNFMTCVRSNPVKAHDGNIWMKTAGEADGRIFPYGTFHKCLIGHAIQCTDKCKLLLSEGTETELDDCNCEKKGAPVNPYGSNSQIPHSSYSQGNNNQQNGGSYNSIYSNENNGPLYPQTFFNTGQSSLSDILEAASGK